MKNYLLLVSGLGLLSAAHSAVAEPSCPQFFLQGTEPKVEGKVMLLCNNHYAVGYNKEARSSLWGAEHLTKSDMLKAAQVQTKDAFKADKRISYTYKIDPDEYMLSIYDKMHLASVKDSPDEESSKQAYLMTNVVPQTKRLKRDKWVPIENKVRDLAVRYGDLYVVTGVIGGSFQDMDLYNPVLREKIPELMYKAVHIPSAKKTFVFTCLNSDAGNDCALMGYENFRKHYPDANPFPGLLEKK